MINNKWNNNIKRKGFLYFYWFFYYTFLCFYVAQTSLKLMILLPPHQNVGITCVYHYDWPVLLVCCLVCNGQVSKWITVVKFALYGHDGKNFQETYWADHTYVLGCLPPLSQLENKWESYYHEIYFESNSESKEEWNINMYF